MSTRGAIGFRLNEKDKVTYNHDNSYPTGIGQDIIDFIQENAIGVMREVAKNIELVHSKDYPTSEQLEEYRKIDPKINTKEQINWYELLRSTQGQLDPFVNNLKFMIESKSFLFESLYCEYAYIINLDTNKLEFYKGFNQNPKAAGRYAKFALTCPAQYYGVELMAEFDLQEIQNNPDGNWIELMNKLSQDKEEIEDDEEVEINVPVNGFKANDDCPQCKRGTLIVKRFAHHNFFGCNHWPRCLFVTKAN